MSVSVHYPVLYQKTKTVEQLVCWIDPCTLPKSDFKDIKHSLKLDRFTSVLVRPVQYTDTAKVISARTRLQGRARHVSDLSVRVCNRKVPPYIVTNNSV